MNELYVINGGRKFQEGIGESYNFGWSPASEEQLSGLLIHDPYEDVPQIVGDKVFLWEFLAAINSGKCPPLNWQLTGSCVNGGAYNAVRFAQGIEIACLPQPEAFVDLFTLLAYGLSRSMLGMTSEGEGSGGLDMAKALGEGVPHIGDPDVPSPHYCGPAVVYDRAVELKWSARRNAPSGLIERAKKHPIQFVRVKSADEAESELRRGRPLTWCGDWGGMMEGVYKGEPRILTMTRRQTWQHQESCHAVWNHPTLKRQFRVQNQWFSPGPDMKVEYTNTRDGRAINRILQAGNAVPVHGEPTLPGEPAGGYWIGDDDMNYQCRNGEVCALKGFSGYTGVPIPFGNI